jgi:hypothetical protein
LNSTDEACFEVLTQLGIVLARPTSSPLLKKFPKGYKHGIDFYSMSALAEVMTNAMRLFKKAHGIYPNIYDPQGFNQKIFYRKFFEPLLIGKVGNKLETANFIPDDLRSVLHCPKVLWRSVNNLLPLNDELPKGHYYLKSNHGSNFYEAIYYPITEKARLTLELECKCWLNSSYGINVSEWWYNVFKKKYLLR